MLIETYVAWLVGFAIVLIFVYALVQLKMINKYLPKQVRNLLQNKELKEFIVRIAHHVELDNETKRIEAVKRIRAFVKERFGYEIPDRYANLIVEALVTRLKDEGIIPKATVELPVDPKAPLDKKPEEVREPDPGELKPIDNPTSKPED